MEYLFTFESSHMAIACERLVRNYFKDSRLIPLPPKIDAGCGLVLRVYEKDFEKIKQLIDREAIKYDNIYLKRDNEYIKKDF